MSTGQKEHFISQLRRFAREGGGWMPDGYGRIGYQESRGERMLAGMIANYLSGPEIPAEDPYGNWYVHLDDHLVDAHVEFQTLPKWEGWRVQYKLETGEDVPDLEHLHVGGLHRLLVCRDLSRLCSLLAGDRGGDWLRGRLEERFNAQRTCVDQAWRRFVRTCYRQLMPRIKAESHRGNKGRFGYTTLMTYAMAGRVMFTFTRDDGEQLTYVADDPDMYGCRSGANATSTPYADCVSMINDVVDHWQMADLAPDTEVRIAGMPA